MNDTTNKQQYEQLIEELYQKNKAYNDLLASEDIEESKKRVAPILEDFDLDAMGNTIAFKGNNTLKSKKCMLPLTQEHIEEFIHCSTHPVYTIMNYFIINSQTFGMTKFKLWDFQTDMIKSMFAEDRFLCKIGRQQGKTSVTAAFICFYCLFSKDKKVIVVANKLAKAVDSLNMIKDMIINLPNWLKPGVLKWNSTSVKFENGCEITASSTSSNAARGFTAGILYIDEMAFIEKKLWDKFYRSVFPAVSSSKLAKIISSSTPQGKNHFYYFWQRAIKGINGYKAYEVSWSAVPGRNEEWKQKQIAEMGSIEAFNQEYNCDFGDTGRNLLSKIAMDNMEHSLKDPIQYKNSDDNLTKRIWSIIEPPQKTHEYILTADVAEGKGLDSSAISIIDISVMPIKLVAALKNNQESLISFSDTILRWAHDYNDAFCLIENNSIGQAVVSDLVDDLGYGNVVSVLLDGKDGKKYTEYGLRTTKKTRRIGLDYLKYLIEGEKFTIEEYMVFEEFTGFQYNEDKNRYEAVDTDINDDLVMSLVMFASYLKNKDFNHLTTLSTSLRRNLFDKPKSQQKYNCMIRNGIGSEQGKEKDKQKEQLEWAKRISN